MKLNKLVYLAHGWGLGILGESLIEEPVQAWKYGPVIPSLYHHFKDFGDDIIPSLHAETIINEDIDETASELVDAVWDTYKEHSALSLSTLTHEYNTPWYEVWHKAGGKNRKGSNVNDSIIERYYKDKINQ